MSHPMRKLVIHTFERRDHHDGGKKWLAKFHPYSGCLVYFTGDTEQEAIDAAEALRTEAIEKHEASCIAREEGRKKAAASRAKKKGDAA